MNWENKSILVVEDDDSSFQYIEAVLKPTMAKVIRARDGLLAIEMIQKESKIDLILMDIQLPGVNGLEALYQIKEINPGLPQIAQTAYAMESDEKELLAAGFDAYLAKPFKKRDLLQAIERFI